MDMERLEKFAKDLFKEYNSEGSRTATNIVQVDKGEDYLVYQYDYKPLNGPAKRLEKKFLYNNKGEIIHKGPLVVED